MTDKTTKAAPKTIPPKKSGPVPAADRSVAARVAAGQQRNAARPTFREVVEDHPVAAVAGGILLGALLARALPRLPFGKLASRATTLAAVGAELAALYGSRAAEIAGEAAHDGREKLGELGGTVLDASGDARRRSAELADAAVAGARSAGSSALRKVTELASRARH